MVLVVTLACSSAYTLLHKAGSRIGAHACVFMFMYVGNFGSSEMVMDCEAINR